MKRRPVPGFAWAALMEVAEAGHVGRAKLLAPFGGPKDPRLFAPTPDRPTAPIVFGKRAAFKSRMMPALVFICLGQRILVAWFNLASARIVQIYAALHGAHNCAPVYCKIYYYIDTITLAWSAFRPGSTENGMSELSKDLQTLISGANTTASYACPFPITINLNPDGGSPAVTPTPERR